MWDEFKLGGLVERDGDRLIPLTVLLTRGGLIDDYRLIVTD